jgi:1-deoxy-D-xylulose-5-phosphate reductoisomerase
MDNILILGSTGSIGRMTLEVISWLSHRMRAYALTTYRNTSLLKKQIEKYKPEVVGVVDREFEYPGVKIFSGKEGLKKIVSLPEVDTVMVGIVGAESVYPTLSAIKSGKRVLMANKESLVSFGEVIMREAREKGVSILPVDSEHSAIYQCIQGREKFVDRIILTASGGPFREKRLNNSITPEDALKHPRWKMGRKITIDSATLMNKGLEVIEACRLFDIAPEKIDIVIHPESIVHSMVKFVDGSVLSQMSLPDMRLPIQYALTYPDRVPSLIKPLDLTEIQSLHFYSPDYKKFPCIQLAYQAIRDGGTMPAVLNASDEVVVHAFLKGRIPFTFIPETIKTVMKEHKVVHNTTIGEIEISDSWARKKAKDVIANYRRHSCS